MTEIKPGMLCLVRGITQTGGPTGKVVTATEFLGEHRGALNIQVERYGFLGLWRREYVSQSVVQNAWRCEAQESKWAIDAAFLVPLSDPTADIDNTEAFDDEIELVRRAAGLVR